MKKTHKTLFNKNHISFEYYDDDIVTQAYINVVAKYNTTNSVQNYNPYKSGWRKPKYEIVRTKSPLGFYYDKRVLVNKTPEKNTQTNTCMKIWTFYIGTRIYKLSYYIEYNGTHINQEIRPWHICEGDKSMPDHYVDALLSELNNMFSDITVLKNKDIRDISSNENEYYSWNRYNRYNTFNIKDNTKKREIFTDLFGYPEGPKYQTNEEKILSHGFDLKTSFRKM